MLGAMAAQPKVRKVAQRQQKTKLSVLEKPQEVKNINTEAKQVLCSSSTLQRVLMTVPDGMHCTAASVFALSALPGYKTVCSTESHTKPHDSCCGTEPQESTQVL